MNGPGGGGGAPGGGGGAAQGPGAGAGAAGGCAAGRAVRRSRSQGTRKLHKCLSTASDVYAAPPAPQHSLLTTRQYCSFGSTVTLYEVTLSFVSFHSETVAISSLVIFYFWFVLNDLLLRRRCERSLDRASIWASEHAIRVRHAHFQLFWTDDILVLYLIFILIWPLPMGHSRYVSFSF